MRNLLATVPHQDKASVAKAVRWVFDQPILQSTHIQLRELVAKLCRVYLDTVRLLAAVELDILTYKTFPKAQRRSAAEPK